MRSCDSDVILVLCEFVHNVLLGHFRVNVRDLDRYRSIFVNVLKEKSSMDKRRALLLTKTGFELIQLFIKFCFMHLSQTISIAEEFILIPKNQLSSQIPSDPEFSKPVLNFLF